MHREFSLPQAEAMASYVRRILADLCQITAQRAHLHRRFDLLEDCRQSDLFAVREQYYRAHRQIDETDREWGTTFEELDDLGVQLLDPVQGVAGFPFRCATHEGAKEFEDAFFTIRLQDDADDGLNHWRLGSEGEDQVIPSHWRQNGNGAPTAGEEVTSNSSDAEPLVDGVGGINGDA